MNHLSRIVNGILIYMAIFTPVCAILQAITGVALSGYITGSGIFGIVELALSCVIKITESRKIKNKSDEDEEN